MRQYHIFLFAALLMSGCATTSTVKNVEREMGISPLTALSLSHYPTLKKQIDATPSDSLFPLN